MCASLAVPMNESPPVESLTGLYVMTPPRLTTLPPPPPPPPPHCHYNHDDSDDSDDSDDNGASCSNGRIYDRDPSQPPPPPRPPSLLHPSSARHRCRTQPAHARRIDRWTDGPTARPTARSTAMTCERSRGAMLSHPCHSTAMATFACFYESLSQPCIAIAAGASSARSRP